MKKIIKKYHIEILSFILPSLIFLIACLINHYYPFGNKTLILYDASSQYQGFFSYYKEVLTNNQSLFYSFKGILGYNFYATAAYYLFNPVNLLIIFFNNNSQIVFYTLIIFLRISLSGLTMCKYLKYKFKNTNNIFTIIFSITYALMAYNIVYFYNFMFFDSIVLFPLVMIGIDKIINENKPKYYIVTLTLSILSNFYIGYMICIFSVIYFAYNYYISNNKNKKIIKMFIISSLLSGIMCSIVLIPTLYELLQGKAQLFSHDTSTNYFNFNLNFLNIFYKLTPGSFKTSDVQYGTVNIYYTLFASILTIKYFFNKNINKKEKKASLIIIIFFLISISFNLIDYAWHMFQRPIWYPNRYIFTFTFFLITLAYKQSTTTNSKIEYKQKFLILLSFIILLIYPAINANFFDFPIKIICFIFSILLLVQYIFNSNSKILLTLFFIELLLNTSISLESLNSGLYKDPFISNNKIYTNLTNTIKNNETTNNFYRVEYSTYNNYNNGATYLYNGLNFFNSLKNGKTIDFIKNKIEYDIKDDSTLVYTFENPYVNSLLGIKYFTASNKEDYYKKLNKNNNIYINNDALPLIFKSSKNIKDTKLVNNNRNENINKIVNDILNTNVKTYEILKINKYTNIKQEKNRLIKINNKEDGYIEYNGTIEEDGFLIIHDDINLFTQANIIIDNENKNYYITSNKTPILLKKGQTYKITLKSILNEYNSKIAQITFLPLKTYQTFIKNIKKDFKITKYQKDNNIKGTIKPINKDELYLTTIPYDKGWNIKINNENINYNKCLDTFICFETRKDAKTIELTFIPVGFKIGSLISLMSLLITIIYLRKKALDN